VRDVHPTHYGRICPIETPEGPNIGLINSLATSTRASTTTASSRRRTAASRRAARSPKIDYLSAIEEGQFVIAQANATLGRQGQIRRRDCHRAARRVHLVGARQVDFMDVSPKQIVSVAAALIPFLEHDDANRALMGSNMQRQAVPTAASETPLVGTGMEGIVARSTPASRCRGAAAAWSIRSTPRASCARQRRRNDRGEPASISILDSSTRVRTRTPASTSARWSKSATDVIKRGDVSPTARRRTWASSRSASNVLVAFMPWNGYNFEDSILISERIVERRRLHLDPHRGIRPAWRATPSSAPKKSPAIFPNVGEEAAWRSSTKPASFISAPKCAPATFWSARSRRRARRS
jgi:DNA-directed RNA polymerase subunit beta